MLTERLNSDPGEVIETPARNAEELMRLAHAAQDPATQAWRLMWARGFRLLAALGGEGERKQG